jgi:hypothetical protein
LLAAVRMLPVASMTSAWECGAFFSGLLSAGTPFSIGGFRRGC